MATLRAGARGVESYLPTPLRTM